MENIDYQTVTVKPEKAEKKLIRRQYTKTALIIIINIVLFNVVLVLLATLICGAIGGDFSTYSEMKQNAARVLENDDLSTVISCLVPILSETLAILIGVKLLRLDLKKLFTRDGFTGGELAKECSICLGVQTLAALIAAAVGFILKQFGLESATADLTAQNNSAWSLWIMYFYASLLGPVLEELLYRGVILQSMRKYNERFAIVLSALIFGLMHQNYQQFILAFMLGLILAAADLRSGSIIPSIVMHIIVNTSGVLMQLAMQAADYDTFAKVAAGDANAAMTGNTSFMILVMLNAVFRYGFMFLGIALLIVSIVKGGTVRKPTPAGKSRGVPMLLTTPLWYVVFIVYIYLCFVAPITKIQ
ncbi:MAG: lysostaphin resistance A-like protein [Oscillospiraceae bacterium]